MKSNRKYLLAILLNCRNIVVFIYDLAMGSSMA